MARDARTDTTYRVLLYKVLNDDTPVFRDVFYTEDTGQISFDMKFEGAPATDDHDSAIHVAREALKLIEDAEGYVILECKPISVVTRKETAN